jgi:pilus assembly protein FimV
MVALTLPFMVSATGLGKLTLNSYLGQPFNAKIDLVSVKKEDISSLTVNLASSDTFRLANVDYARLLRTIEFSIENSVDGQPYVKLVSSQPVIEPSFSMLIELNWPSGSLIREYTVQLAEDMSQTVPPVMQQDELVIPISVKPDPTVAEQPDHSGTVEDLAGDREPTVKTSMPEPEQETVPAKKSGTNTYGPVKSGDTLTKIIQERIFYNVQLNQILVSLLRANREAFVENNINRLKTGYMLRIPDESEIVTISPDVADKEVTMQMANWENYRQRLVIEAASIPYSSEEPEQTATGKITTVLDDNNDTETAHEYSEGLLRLSKGMEDVVGTEEGSDEGTMNIQEKFNIVKDNSIADEMALNEANKRISLLEQAMQENQIANIKELNESNQRIMALEKNIKELQYLLVELKNPTMASAEAQAESILSEASDSPPVIIEKTAGAVQPSVDSAEREESNPTKESNPTIMNWVLWIMILLLIIGIFWKVKQSRADSNSKSSDKL